MAGSPVPWRCALSRRVPGRHGAIGRPMARQKRLGKTLPTRLRSHIHSVTCAQLLLSKSLSSQLVLLQLHSGQMLLEHVRREPPNRRE